MILATLYSVFSPKNREFNVHITNALLLQYVHSCNNIYTYTKKKSLVVRNGLPFDISRIKD